MMKLAQLEWMKLKRSMTAKAILAVYAVVVPFMYWMFSLLEIGPFQVPTSAYQFPDAYHLAAWCASWFNLMVGVIIIVYTTNEIKFKTQRQNTIDGLRKIDVIFSKLIVVVGLAVIVSIYTFLVALVAGFINGSENSMLDGIDIIGTYFVSTLGYFSFAYFFASLVRLPALAIVIYIFSTIIEGIVGFIAAQQYGQLFPLTTFARLVPFPSEIFVGNQSDSNLLSVGQGSLLAIFYISLFVAGTYWMIKRRDI